MKNLMTEVERVIRLKKLNKDLVSSQIGMKYNSFYKMLKNGDMKLTNFNKLIIFLKIEPNDFFQWDEISKDFHLPETANDTVLDTCNVPTSEVEFLRGQIITLNTQINTLTNAIAKLSGK